MFPISDYGCNVLAKQLSERYILNERNDKFFKVYGEFDEYNNEVAWASVWDEGTSTVELNGEGISFNRENR